MTPAERVHAVLVTYNSAAVIADALKSLPDTTQTTVVDNASRDATASVVKGMNVPIFVSSSNIGFGNACNLGAREAEREFLLFLNPDARLQPGALDALVAAADNNANSAAFNPRLLRANGSQFFRVRSHLFPETKRAKRQTPTGDQDIKILSGAAFLCRRALFEEMGGFDPHIFMYCEDDDLGLRLRKAGWTLRYVHDAVVVHQGNQSSAPSDALEVTKAYHEMRSRWYTAVKHGVGFSRAGKLSQSVVNWLSAVLTMNRARRIKNAAHIKALLEERPASDET